MPPAPLPAAPTAGQIDRAPRFPAGRRARCHLPPQILIHWIRPKNHTIGRKPTVVQHGVKTKLSPFQNRPVRKTTIGRQAIRNPTSQVLAAFRQQWASSLALVLEVSVVFRVRVRPSLILALATTVHLKSPGPAEDREGARCLKKNSSIRPAPKEKNSKKCPSHAGR